MAANNLPKTGKGLSQLCGKMIKGVNTVGASVPVTMVTAPQMQSALIAFNLADTAFGNARKALSDAYDVFTPATATLLDWLNAARPIFVSHFGYSWSANWAAAGFVDNSTAIPSQIEDRLALAASIITYLAANPTFEVPATGVTVDSGTDIRAYALATQQTVLTAERALKDAGTTRDPLQAALEKLMRALIKNLAGLLAKDDPRWIAFGLEMPATPTTPQKPTGLQAQYDEMSGGIIMTCDAQPLAQRFRWRGRTTGSGLPFQLIASSTEPTGRTKPVEPGSALELMVQAVNGGSQSVPSDSIIFPVPSTTPAKPAPTAPAAADTSSNASNGNGTTNGSGMLAPSRLS